MDVAGRTSVATRQVIPETMVMRASDRNRFALRLTLFVNVNSSAKLSPVMIAATAARSPSVIWNVNEFNLKQ